MSDYAVQEPAPYSGIGLGAGFSAWVARNLDEDEAEDALVLRRAIFISSGRGLAPWHPLISGDPKSVERAGISVRGQVFSETILAEVEDAIDFPAPEFLHDPDLDPGDEPGA